MNEVETYHPPSIASTWDRQLPLAEKLKILTEIFGAPLEEVKFWDLYRMVKKLNS